MTMVFPQLIYGCLCATMLYLETQVLREGDYLVSYYAAVGFQPAKCLLMLAFPLVTIKYTNNVVFTQRPNYKKENEDALVTFVGAVLANAFSLKSYKVLHFTGVGLWLYGCASSYYSTKKSKERDERCDTYCRTHREGSY